MGDAFHNAETVRSPQTTKYLKTCHSRAQLRNLYLTLQFIPARPKSQCHVPVATFKHNSCRHLKQAEGPHHKLLLLDDATHSGRT